MELKVITYNYTQDNILTSKVVGIFLINQLEDAFKIIVKTFGDDKILHYDETSDNYFLSFDNDEKSYFYTSNYTVGELNL